MTYGGVSISFLHLQTQLIPYHSVDLSQIKQPWPRLFVSLVSERQVRKEGGGRQNKEELVLMTLILGPFFICQSVEWHYTSLSQFICFLSYLQHERPRPPHLKANDICQHLSRKTKVREMEWHLSPPCSCLGHVPPPTHMNHINANWSFVIFAQWPTFPAHANRMQPSHEAAATFALAQMNDFAFKLFVWCNLLALCWIKECSIMLFIWCKVTPTQTGLLWCCSGLTFPKYWGACPQMSDHFLLCGSCSCLCSRGPRAWKVKPMQSYSFFLMDFGWPE